MYLKHSILVALLIAVWLLALTEGQLTFSPDWGKRSSGLASNTNNNGLFYDTPAINCRTNNDMLMEIFHFIQNEAKQYLDCKHRE